MSRSKRAAALLFGVDRSTSAHSSSGPSARHKQHWGIVGFALSVQSRFQAGCIQLSQFINTALLQNAATSKEAFSYVSKKLNLSFNLSFLSGFASALMGSLVKLHWGDFRSSRSHFSCRLSSAYEGMVGHMILISCVQRVSWSGPLRTAQLGPRDQLFADPWGQIFK